MQGGELKKVEMNKTVSFSPDFYSVQPGNTFHGKLPNGQCIVKYDCTGQPHAVYFIERVFTPDVRSCEVYLPDV
jgi:hypothetical protein